MIDAETVQLREALPAEVRLVVVADHGMVDATTPDARLDVEDHDGAAGRAGPARR